MSARHKKIALYFAAVTVGLWFAGVASGYGRPAARPRGW